MSVTWEKLVYAGHKHSALWASDGSPQAVWVDAAGLVGIGVDAPNTKLTLNDGVFSLTNTNVEHGMTLLGLGNAYGLVGPRDADGGGLSIIGISDNTDIGGLILTGIIGSSGSENLTTPAILMVAAREYDPGFAAVGATRTAFQLRNNSTNLVTVLGSGNVGIGTASPTSLCHSSLATSGLAPLLYTNATLPTYPRTIFTASAAISTTDTTAATGPVVGLNLENSSETANMYSPLITFSRKSGIYNSIYAFIGGACTGNGDAGNFSAGVLIFATSPIGSGTGPLERMRITDTGNVSIGVTAFGTSAAKVLGIGSGTAPSTSPADMAQVWVADRAAAAGKAELHARYEDGQVGAIPLEGESIDYSATSTIVGWASFTTCVLSCRRVGKIVYVNFNLAGPSNSATTTCTLPWAARTSTPAYVVALCAAKDNSVQLGPPGEFYMSQGSAVITFGKNTNIAAFSATGDKQVTGQFFYEID